MPKISICLPCLNTVEYLEERFETILSQTFTDWECFVYDSFSDDGSWEIICKYVQQDPRIRARQGPREGIYPAWNRCIQETHGDYIYIATSDDTMANDCLEKLVSALDQNPSCGIAHCSLNAVGEGASDYNLMWNESFMFSMSSRDLRHRTHIRKAPFDAVLQLTQHTIYTSVTQLLIRRDLMNRAGLFHSTWGSAGDFHWYMRACFLTDTIHVHDTWGGWRLHAGQSTDFLKINTPKYRSMIQEMIKDAIRMSWDHIPESIRSDLNRKWISYFYENWIFDYEFSRIKNRYFKLCFVAKKFASGSHAARIYLAKRLFNKSDIEYQPDEIVKDWLNGKGFCDLLQPV